MINYYISHLIKENKSTSIDLNELYNNLSMEFDIIEIRNELNLSPSVTTFARILAIVGVCSCLIGIVGNTLSIIVLKRKPMKRLSTYSYLLGLSVCDVISLFLTVFILLHYSISFYEFSQEITNYHMMMLLYIYPVVNAFHALSVWITLAFTIDRYLYVCKPYFGRRYCTRKNAYIILTILYFLAILYAMPQFFERTYIIIDVLGIKHVFHNFTKFGLNKYFIYIYHLFVYCMFVFLIPFTFILVLNTFLVLDIIKSNKRHKHLDYSCRLYLHRDSRQLQRSSSVFSRRFDSFYNSNSESVKLSLTSCFNKRNSTSEQNIESSNSNNNQTNTQINTNGKNSGMMRSYLKSGSISNERALYTLSNDVTIMLVGLTITFVICQTPSIVLRLMTFKNLSSYFKPIYYSSLDLSNFLIVSNSTLNCILYVMLGKKFRREFIAAFFRPHSSTMS